MILLFANQKGGSGKTTTAVAFAYHLAQLRYRVLLLDLDPQGHGTSSSGLLPPAFAGSDTSTLADVLAGRTAPQAAVTATAYGYDLIPSDENLLAVELGQTVPTEALEKRFAYALRSLSYDYILLDSQAHLGAITKCALFSADRVIIPVEAHPLSLLGLYQFADNIEAIQSDPALNPRLRIAGILLTKWAAAEKICNQVLANLDAGRLQRYLMPDRISRSTDVAKASSASWAEGGGSYTGLKIPLGQPIQLFSPTCNAAKDYAFAVDDFLAKQQEARP